MSKAADRENEEGNHAKNNARMIREMSGQEVRTARFRCVMVLAEAGEVLAHFEESGGGDLAMIRCLRRRGMIRVSRSWARR